MVASPLRHLSFERGDDAIAFGVDQVANIDWGYCASVDDSAIGYIVSHAPPSFPASVAASAAGTIQQESTAPRLRKKVIVLRKTTDRPEAIDLGYSELVGTKTKDILRAINRNIKDPKIPTRASPYGNGKAAEKIFKILSKQF